jgi:DNA-binding NarL/FixJ family response regulator
MDWYQRDTVADGIICENPYTLSLIDYRVGFENGIEIIKKVKARCPQKAVFLYTDWGDSRLLEEALDAGAAGVIKKSSLCPEIIQQYIEPYLI